MTTELWLLFWSLPLYGLYLGTQSSILRHDHGVEYAATARDTPPPKSKYEARADRALRNFHETWPVFIVLMLIAHLANQGDPLVFWGAIVWGVARIVYLPLYLFGTFMVRSLAWFVSFLGLCAMFLAVLV